MVDVTFKSRAKQFVSLALMKRIAALSTSDPPEDLAYIGKDGVEAIKNMALIKRGRLSVQPVEEDAWTAIHLLADKGGWDENEKKSGSRKSESSSKKGKVEGSKKTSRKRKQGDTIWTSHQSYFRANSDNILQTRNLIPNPRMLQIVLKKGTK